MTLKPGCPLVVAPFFYIDIDWRERLSGGTHFSCQRGKYFAHPPWRALDEQELVLLAPPGPTAESGDLCLCLFRLPNHLLQAWWQVLERSQGKTEQGLEGFAPFVRKVGEFLAFKDIASPERATFDLLVSAPGQAADDRDETTRGLAFNPGSACQNREKSVRQELRLWGAINLGDQAASLVFLNLTAPNLVAELRRSEQGLNSLTAMDDLADRFLASSPDYPPLRLRVEPGEGFRLPGVGFLADVCTADQTEPELWLLIRDRRQHIQ